MGTLAEAINSRCPSGCVLQAFWRRIRITARRWLDSGRVYLWPALGRLYQTEDPPAAWNDQTLVRQPPRMRYRPSCRKGTSGTVDNSLSRVLSIFPRHRRVALAPRVPTPPSSCWPTLMTVNWGTTESLNQKQRGRCASLFSVMTPRRARCVTDSGRSNTTANACRTRRGHALVPWAHAVDSGSARRGVCCLQHRHRRRRGENPF